MSVRRVRRIIRKIDPWTVLKVSLVLNAIGALVWILGVWISWSIAIQRGIPEALVDLLAQLTIAVTPDGNLYFRVVVMSAIVWVIATTGALPLAAVLYNLISDIVGGVELIMLEEVPDAPTTPEPQRPRPVVHVPANGAGTSKLSVEETVEQTSGV